MAKKAKPETKPFDKVLHSLEEDRKKSGCIMTNEQLEFIVKLVKASA